MKTDMKNEKNRSKGLLYRILLLIFLIGLIVCIALFVRSRIAQKRAEKIFSEMSAQSTETVSQETEMPEESDILAEPGIEAPEKNLDWEALAEQNGDIYAWIYIPGTQVDYPVLQHQTEDDYYLRHNVDDSSGYPGCIYTQSLNSRDFTDPNTVLYGHNMKNGSMFGSLHEFEDNTFFEENRYVYIYTPDAAYCYEIFAACEFSDAHLLYQYDFSTQGGFEAYLDDVMNVRDMNSHVRTETEVTAESRILTLSTCVSGKANRRYLVTAVLLDSIDGNE